MGENLQYDVTIVGAGPAGLSAARTMARLGFSTLVIERAGESDSQGHPCSAILAPMPGFVKGRRLLGDLFYPELDLLIPLSLVVGYPRLQRFISPNGTEVEAAYSRGDGSPVAAIDKAGLLRLMREQATRCGAEFRFGTAALGLLTEGSQITGVRTTAGEIRSALVLAAEGTERRLSRAAGLYADTDRATRHAFILSRELAAPRVRRQNLGQITTFGQRYTSARESFGTVVMPVAGRASVYFTLLAEGPNHHTEHSAAYYMDEYVSEDPRVRDLLAGSTTLQEARWSIAIHEGPTQVACPGFMSLGDAATPAGHVGLLGAMWLGRKAALVAAEALDTDDLSTDTLSMYGHLFHSRVLSSLQTERNLMLGLVQMADRDLDQLAHALSGLPLAAPFFSGWQGIPWEAANWLARHYPAGSYQTSTLQRILDHEAEHNNSALELPTGLWPVPLRAGSSVS